MSLATTGVPAAKASVRTMPKLSPPSDGAHRTSAAASASRALVVGDLAQHGDAARVEQQRLDVVGAGADDHQLGGTCSRSASKARSRIGRPLRSTAWPTKAMRSGASRRAPAPAGAGTVTPLGMIR